MRLIIRQANANDAVGIARVHVTGWTISYSGMFDDSVLDAISVEEKTQTWFKRLSSPLPDSKNFVAELNT